MQAGQEDRVSPPLEADLALPLLSQLTDLYLELLLQRRELVDAQGKTLEVLIGCRLRRCGCWGSGGRLLHVGDYVGGGERCQGRALWGGGPVGVVKAGWGFCELLLLTVVFTRLLHSEVGQRVGRRGRARLDKVGDVVSSLRCLQLLLFARGLGGEVGEPLGKQRGGGDPGVESRVLHDVEVGREPLEEPLQLARLDGLA